MKRSTLTFAVLLPAVCAATAAAQIAPIRFSAPVNPIAGMPISLPSPLTGPLAGNGITLPNLVPALTPTLRLSAPAPLLASLPTAPVLLPSRPGSLPAADAARDGVNNPLRRVLPGVTIRFAAAAAGSASASGAPSVKATPDEMKDGLDDAFDGSERTRREPVVSRRGPISPERHISLPETDLEHELGL